MRLPRKGKMYTAGFLIAALLAFWVPAADAATITVCTSGCDHTTIQAAVTAAVPGDTISIAAGVYDEQVVITKQLTLQGAGGTTVIKPSAASQLTSVYTTGTQGGGAFFDAIAIAPIVQVSGVGTSGVTLKDLKVDGESVTSLPSGAAHVSGIVYGESAGTIDNVTVEDTNLVSPSSVRTYSVWVDAVGATPVTVNVTNSIARLYGRNGLNGRGNSLTVNFDGNTITGPGTVGPAQVPNGVLLISGASGTVTDNTVSANHYTGSSFLGSGILLFQAKASSVTVSGNEVFDVDDAILLAGTSAANIQNNNLHNNVKAVQIEQAGATNNAITGNTVASNTYGVFLAASAGAGNNAGSNAITNSSTAAVNNESANAFAANDNWWGQTSGPVAGQLTGSGGTTATRWCTQANCSTLSTTADLAAMSLSSGTLNPTFSSATTTYTASVSNDVTSVTPSCTGTPGTNVATSGGSNLSVGDNTVTCTVTSADGSVQKQYTATVTKAAPPSPPPQPATTTTTAPPPSTTTTTAPPAPTTTTTVPAVVARPHSDPPPPPAPPVEPEVVNVITTESGNGSIQIMPNGEIISTGDAPKFEGVSDMPLNAPVVSGSLTPSGTGMWLVGADGGVFTQGDAPFLGSAGNLDLNAPVTGIAPTPTGKGYILVGADGGIFTFGDAKFHGSLGDRPLNQPAVGVSTTPSGNGYIVVAKDGGIFTFGDAKFFGSAATSPLESPAKSAIMTSTAKGYWIILENGRTIAFGDAKPVT